MENVKNDIIKSLAVLMLLSLSSSLFSCGGQVSTSSISTPGVDVDWNGKCYTGSQTPKMYLGNPNDFYVETVDGDIHVKVTDEEWKQISNIKDLPYIYDNKWELHVNYDGYFYVNEKGTDALVKNHIKQGVIENTLELKDNKYFGKNKTITTKDHIILMGNYKNRANVTHYNELLVEQVSTYVKGIGALEFGRYNLKTKEYNRSFKVIVNEGLNNIKLNMTLGFNETLCIGGSESTVSLYVSDGIVNDDQNGLYTKNKDNLNLEDSRLILNVKAKTSSLKSNFPNVSVYENENILNYNNINYEGAPIILQNYKQFENQKIAKIKLPIESVKTISDKYYFTLSVLNQNYLKNNNLAENTIREYKLDLTSYLSDITDLKVGKWIEVDLSSLNIEIKEGEMLGLAKNTDNVYICIDRSVHNSELPEFNFYLPYYRDTLFTQNVFLDIYTYEYLTLEGHLEKIEKLNQVSLLKGKKISILGDSISSFKGYSNDTSVNSTLGSNGTHYTGSNCGVTSVNQTWWMSLVNKGEMELIVNNSSAGDEIGSGGLNRCLQLHNNDGVNPEVICMFFGINDIWRPNKTLDTFKTNYLKLLSLMQNKYTEAKIFVSTYLPYTWWTGGDSSTVYHKTKEELEPYNEFVRETVKTLDDVYLVDLARDSGITFDNYKEYMANETNRWLHPNATGMSLISETYYNALNKNL